MKVRKYTKEFKNRGSAKRVYERKSHTWINGNLPDEQMPNMETKHYYENNKLQFRYIVTYYSTKYNPKPENTIKDSTLYGKNITDVKKKFIKLMTDNFKEYKVAVKNIKLEKKHSDNLNLYKIFFTMKKKKVI
jgi:hypothetical protein